MNTIKVTIKDRLSLITLDRGKSNAMNREMLEELSSILESISADEHIGGVIITGKEGFFSAGLDLIELYHYSEEEAESFWSLFLKFSALIIAFKKPIVAAINGHSPAGGCLLALACDARVMSEGKFIIGLNEVPVGIIVPHSVFALYAFWLGEATAYRSMLEGKLFSPEEALKVGLVDDVVNPSGILTAAERKIRKFMEMDGNTWQQSKLHLRKNLIEVSQADQSQELQCMLEQWWSPSTRNILKTILHNLHHK